MGRIRPVPLRQIRHVELAFYCALFAASERIDIWPISQKRGSPFLKGIIWGLHPIDLSELPTALETFSPPPVSAARSNCKRGRRDGQAFNVSERCQSSLAERCFQ